MTQLRTPTLRERQSTTAVEHTNRYQLMTAAALTALQPTLIPDRQIAEEVLSNAETSGLLVSGWLYRDRPCYFPKPNGRASCLSESSKIRAYAFLSICASPESKCSRLTRLDFQTYFPDIPGDLLPMNYVTNFGGDNPTLDFVRIDLCGAGRWDRIVAKAMDDARKHLLNPNFKWLVDRRALQIRIVTALPQKANRILRAIQDRPSCPDIPIHINVVPELVNLIVPLAR